jgi:hypothetical protein
LRNPARPLPRSIPSSIDMTLKWGFKMNKALDKHISSAVRKLYLNDEPAKAIFDRFASRQRDARETPIERTAWMAECEYPEVLRVFRELADLGVGHLLMGRKGRKSRMKWHYSIRSLGQAAQGGTDMTAPHRRSASIGSRFQ